MACSQANAQTRPEPVQNQLLGCGFIDSHLLNNCLDENVCLQRFIDERVVGFQGNDVIAPIWDFVNHSSFSSAFSFFDCVNKFVYHR